MNKYLKIASPFVFLISLILILALKTVPSGKLWKEYQVLYVPVSSPDSAVMTALNNEEIKNVICLSDQYLPILLSENSIEISMLRLNYNSPDNAYINKRSSLFYDKSKNYRLYYIPAEYKQKLFAVIKTLESSGISCGTDGSSAYPWLLPLIAVLLCGMLFLFAKNKFVFIAGSILPLLFLYSNPFYPIALATCLILLCIFFTSNIWKRKGAVKKLINQKFVPLMLGISFICAFSSAVSSGFLFILCAAGTASILYFWYYAETFIRNRKSFVPVFIRSAKRVSVFAGKSSLTLSITTGAAVLLIAIFFLTASDSVSSHIAKLLLPAASSTQSEALAQLDEYYRWNWNVVTLPYKSLNGNTNEQGDRIEFPDFTEDEVSGLITQTNKVFVYDDAFKQKVYNNIDKLSFAAVEKLMKSEGNDFIAGYSATNGYQTHLFGVIMMFICFFVLLFMYICIIINSSKKARRY